MSNTRPSSAGTTTAFGGTWRRPKSAGPSSFGSSNSARNPFGADYSRLSTPNLQINQDNIKAARKNSNNTTSHDQWSSAYKLHYGFSGAIEAAIPLVSSRPSTAKYEPPDAARLAPLTINNANGSATSGKSNSGKMQPPPPITKPLSVIDTKYTKVAPVIAARQQQADANPPPSYKPSAVPSIVGETTAQPIPQARSAAEKMREAIAASRRKIDADDAAEVARIANPSTAAPNKYTTAAIVNQPTATAKPTIPIVDGKREHPDLDKLVISSAPVEDTEIDQDLTGEAGLQQLLTKEDDDEMDGKKMSINMDSKSHPEVGTPSLTSLEQGVTAPGVRTSASLDSLTEELVDIGISTVPNQFCSVRDAVDLKRMLLLTHGVRGGLVPSSTSVMDMYMVGKVIGVGSYGKVRAAWHRLTGAKVAIKTYDKSKMKDESHYKRVYSEIKIMETSSHPRIARMYEAIETPKRMHLIMECLEGLNLCSYVKQKKRLHEDEARIIFFQLIQSIEYLHNMNIAHRDIKLENILFTYTSNTTTSTTTNSNNNNSKDIKLIDFGFSTICTPGKKLKVFCGTPSYM